MAADPPRSSLNVTSTQFVVTLGVWAGGIAAILCPVAYD